MEYSNALAGRVYYREMGVKGIISLTFSPPVS
jgi:hypothetical protein